MANMAILAVADLVSFRTRILSRVAINQALVGLLGIGLTAIAAAGILSPARFSLLGLTWPSLAIGFTYVAGMRLLHRNRPEPPFRRPEEVKEARSRATPLRWAITGFVISAAVILVAAPYLARSAATPARGLRMARTFNGPRRRSSGFPRPCAPR